MLGEIVEGKDLVSGKHYSTGEQLFGLGTLGAGSLLGKIYKGIKAGMSPEVEEAAGKLSNGTVFAMNSAGGASEIEKLAKNITKKIVGKGEGASEATKASPKVLRQNLIDADIEVPDYANAAHHIVAGTSQKANEARAILQKYGIGINDAPNGVFLPTAKGVSNSAYHPGLHTNTYYNKVNDMIRSATSKNDVLDILNDIADQLLNGTFMK